MITENKIRSLIDSRIEGTDYYILDLQIKPGNEIIVELESTGPVSISDCVDISRAIEHNLDREDEDFSLRVTSPGIDKPLRDRRQFVKNVGRHLKVKLEDGRETEGELTSADQDGIRLLTQRKERLEGKKKRILIEEELALAYPEIKQAKIKINFK